MFTTPSWSLEGIRLKTWGGGDAEDVSDFRNLLLQARGNHLEKGLSIL